MLKSRGLMGTFFTLSENGSFTPVGVFAPCQKKQPVSYRKGKPVQMEEKSMPRTWTPPQIVDSKDDASPEAVVRFMKETDKQEQE
ncbi:hypothetical protein GP661_21705 [Escherichia coli]|nr:hypothetical protein GP661_21705 [Escherichia coli]